MALGLRKGDTVQIMTGNYKGKTGKILRVFPDKERLIVEGMHMVKRHTKPTPKNQKGGIVQKEASIHSSNVMLVCPKTGKPTRIGTAILEGGKRVRFSKKAKESIE
jgi:large subunit ribosomal protein L24